MRERSDKIESGPARLETDQKYRRRASRQRATPRLSYARREIAFAFRPIEFDAIVRFDSVSFSELLLC
jgi:hypothetical protein